MQSIDGARERVAPRHYHGVDLRGELVAGEFEGLTLILAIKEDCLGCRSVLDAPSNSFGDVATMIVAARGATEPGWETTSHRLLISEDLLQQLDVRHPPLYILIDPQNERVVTEGVIFGPSQVRDEIAQFLV